MNTQEQVLATFIEHQAYLKGHFVLSSGQHSEGYMQCARVLQDPQIAESYGQALFQDLEMQNLEWNYAIGPAMGGLIIGHEVARASQVPFLFMERVEGQMTLRRGFELTSGDRVVVVEDVVTTGGSVKEVIEQLKQSGIQVIAVVAVIDRSGGEADFGVPFACLASLKIQTYNADACPLCEQGLDLIKPGSRSFK